MNPSVEFKYLSRECLQLKHDDPENKRLKFIIWISCLLAKYGGSNGASKDIHLDKELTNSLKIHVQILLRENKSDNSLFEYLQCIYKMLEEIDAEERISKTTYINLVVAVSKAAHVKIKMKKQKSDYESFPRIIHLETQAICNAKCSFCDYTDLKRKGTKMSNELIAKILNDLSAIPEDHEFSIEPYKISEPFIEPRLFELIEKLLLLHKKSKICIISNGNHLPQKVIDQITNLLNHDYAWITRDKERECRLILTFSLNESHQNAYEKLMKLKFSKTIDNLKRLQNAISKDLSKMKVILSRVSTSASGDRDFINFCQKEFPLFEHGILKMNNWASSNDYSIHHNQLSSEPREAFGYLSCERWYDLSIMADGNVALCCMDTGTSMLDLGNVKTNNCIELYQAKIKKYIPINNQRSSSPFPCSSCTYFQQGSRLDIALDYMIKMAKKLS